MGDIFIYLIILTVLLRNGLFIWKRFKMENRGYKYPFFRSWPMVRADFKARIEVDSKLKREYELAVTIAIGIGVSLGGLIIYFGL